MQMFSIVVLGGTLNFVFIKSYFFPAQLVSAQRLPALFLFEIFVPLLVI